MAVLAEAFESLKVDNFVVCFNRCPDDFTKEDAREFLQITLEGLSK